VAKRVRHRKGLKGALEAALATPQPTTFVRGPTGGKFICLMARVQAGLPLSARDRDIILGALRKQWLTTKEHAAFLRLAKLKNIEAAEELAKHIVEPRRDLKDSPLDPTAEYVKNTPSGRARWVREILGFRTKGALKAFKKRERKKLRGYK
jgi:hypothetical protein